MHATLNNFEISRNMIHFKKVKNDCVQQTEILQNEYLALRYM